MKSKSLMLSLLVVIGVIAFAFLTIRLAGPGDILYKQGEAYAALEPSTYAAVLISGVLTGWKAIILALSIIGFGYTVYRMKYVGDIKMLKTILPLGATLAIFFTVLLSPAYRTQSITKVYVPARTYDQAGGTIKGLQAIGIDADKLLKETGVNYDVETAQYYTADNPVRPNDYFKNGKKVPIQK